MHTIYSRYSAWENVKLKLQILIIMVGVMAASSVFAKAREFPNCKTLNQVYPHGVGKPGAKDKVSKSKHTRD
jgi:hypothetical protein